MSLPVPLPVVVVGTEINGVSPAMLKIIAAVTVISIVVGIIQRVRLEVGA